ncbi:MAG: LysR family transcriptional regulator [Treponema sp.]|nr:LysR family transcriptional regulator [Treponema sp.]
MNLQPRITIRLFCNDHEKGFGPGIAELLDRISVSGSLRAACSEMNMSYSKGWSILKSCEKSLGFELIERITGGEDGGGSTVTDNGKKMLKCFRQLERQLNEEGKRLIQEQFGNIF